MVRVAMGRRVAEALLVLLAAYTICFALLFLLPSDPIDMVLSRGGDVGYISPQHIQEIKARYGFDLPLYAQYFRRLGLTLTGDLGTSLQTGRPVLRSILEVLPSTVQLVAVAFLLSALIGSGIAIAAWYSDGRWRQLILALPSIGGATPVFWSGLLLLGFFSFKLGWISAVDGYGLASLVLPALVLAIPTGSKIAQVLYDSIASTSQRAFVAVCLAKGSSRARLLFVHILPNAALPVITMLGLTIGEMLSGSVVTEMIFSRPGIGVLTKNAVTTQDIQLVQGIVLLSAAIYVVVNNVVEMIIRSVDPRLNTAR
jgi:peptide/nickel transport system permease protein